MKPILDISKASVYFDGIFLSTITPIFFVSGHRVLILFGNKLIEFSPINIEYFSDLFWNLISWFFIKV